MGRGRPPKRRPQEPIVPKETLETPESEVVSEETLATPAETEEKPPEPIAPKTGKRIVYRATSEILAGEGMRCLPGSEDPTDWPDAIKRDLLKQNAIEAVK